MLLKGVENFNKQKKGGEKAKEITLQEATEKSLIFLS
jgi:hypothetical protein